METLTLNDGTVVNGHILPDAYGDKIFVYLDGMPITDGFVLFSNAEKTGHIVATSYGTEHEYNGFTELLSISSDFGNCNIVMRRGSDA